MNAVHEVYNIARDDAALRGILDRPAQERGGIFDGLRKNYPVRREFQNTRVSVEGGGRSLASKLAGIGFNVIVESKK